MASSRFLIDDAAVACCHRLHGSLRGRDVAGARDDAVLARCSVNHRICMWDRHTQDTRRMTTRRTSHSAPGSSHTPPPFGGTARQQGNGVGSWTTPDCSARGRG